MSQPRCVGPDISLHLLLTGVATLGLALALSSPLRAEAPPPGVDNAPGAGGIEIDVPGVGTEFVRLFNALPDATSVGRGEPVRSPSGFEIPTQLIYLDLSGSSPLFGAVQVQLSNQAVSAGTIRTQSLDADLPARSTFAVFFAVSLPDRGLVLRVAGPLSLEAAINSIPLRQVHVSAPRMAVDLVNAATGQPAGRLRYAAIDFNPTVTCQLTRATLKWSLPAGQETVPLAGRSTLVRSSGFRNPDGLQEVPTELLAMDLSGASALLGALKFNERTEVLSPGRVIARTAWEAAALSSFRVFFKIEDPAGGSFLNADALVMRARGALRRPVEAMHVSVAAVPLRDGRTGDPVGVLDSFSWVWPRQISCCSDTDGDGVFTSPCDDDCDDLDPENYPGNLESCSDGRDNDCDQLQDCADPSCTGRSCDDSDICTDSDVCRESGACAGTPCERGDSCILATCVPYQGCLRNASAAAGTPCDDHDPSTSGDVCDGLGVCHGQPTCDDSNLCTTDAADPVTGACMHSPVVCTVSDVCKPPYPYYCYLADFRCLDIGCDPATGSCSVTPKADGTLCYGDACSDNVCRGGFCASTPKNCDDRNPCTDDFCYFGNCRSVVGSGGQCSDGNACTRGDGCWGSECVPGPPVVCDDQNVCTHDSCDPGSGSCLFEPTAGTACDDGDACTANDVCDAQAHCAGQPDPYCDGAR